MYFELFKKCGNRFSDKLHAGRVQAAAELRQADLAQFEEARNSNCKVLVIIQVFLLTQTLDLLVKVL